MPRAPLARSQRPRCVFGAFGNCFGQRGGLNPTLRPWLETRESFKILSRFYLKEIFAYDVSGRIFQE